MKKNGSRKSLRRTLQQIVALHEGRMRDLKAQLDGGARLGRWTKELSSEFAAGVEVLRIVVKEHDEKAARP